MTVVASYAAASLSYSNPFHPDQCDLAVKSAQRTLSGDRGDASARLILAEGLLCRGLTRDDPWALEDAIQGLEERLAIQPHDFFATLYHAEALKRRFPLADRTVRAFERAGEVLVDADVGDARPALEEHVGASLRWLGSYRERNIPILRDRARKLAAGTLGSDEAGEFFALVTSTGPDGVEWARGALDSYCLRHPGDQVVDTFYRAELLRGTAEPNEVQNLYRSARAAVCPPDTPKSADLCGRIDRRLKQLEGAVECQRSLDLRGGS
jgi:hypothetical protein